jgi:hypothetical protein
VLLKICFSAARFDYYGDKLKCSERMVLADPQSGEIKKDAEASKIVTSPYNCTAEAIFGGRKSGLSFLRRNPIGFHQSCRFGDSDGAKIIWLQIF